MLSQRDPLQQPSLPADERWILNVLAAEEAERADRALQPPFTARLAARLLARRLDRELIRGADPASRPRLAARAALLTSQSTRDELADGLDVVLSSAQRPAGRVHAQPRPAPVLANAALLRELAGVLRGPGPLYVAGIARVRRLLTDGTGPMYTSRDGIALERELRRARISVRC
jgi:hypothetical protein